MMAQALKTAMDWQWREQPGEIDKSLAKLKTLMQVNELTPADKALFVEATNPVYAQFEASVGKEFLDFAQAATGVRLNERRDRRGGAGTLSCHDRAGLRGA